MTNFEQKNDANPAEAAAVTGAVVENQAAAPESYHDIGTERLAGAVDSVKAFGSKVGGWMARGWGKLKSFGSATMEAGKTALVYTLAAPEMAADATVAMGEGLTAGADYVERKVGEGVDYAGRKVVQGANAGFEFGKDVVTTAASTAFEEGVAAYDSAKEGVAYVSEKGKAAYEGAVKFGKEKYAGLQRRAEDARGIFGAAVAEARRRRMERLAGKGNGEYARARAAFEQAKARLVAAERTMAGGGGAVAA